MNTKTENGNGNKKLSIVATTAARYNMEASTFEKTLRATVVPAKCTAEQFAAFLLVAHEYNLNPLTKEIFCFPAQGGGIIPVVSVDGWVNLIQSHKQMDGMEFEDSLDEEGKNLIAVTCRIWRKDRSRPVMVTEYMAECKRSNDVWKTYPRRMLRHKAVIQCARYAFGFAGIYDQDEAERIASSPDQVVDITPTKRPPPPDTEPVEEAKSNDAILEGKFEEINPEATLKAIDGIMSAAMDMGAFNTMWEQVLNNEYKDLTFPSDKNEAEKLYTKHFNRLAKKQ